MRPDEKNSKEPTTVHLSGEFEPSDCFGDFVIVSLVKCEVTKTRMSKHRNPVSRLSR
jgi:hypothetical protein